MYLFIINTCFNNFPDEIVTDSNGKNGVGMDPPDWDCTDSSRGKRLLLEVESMLIPIETPELGQSGETSMSEKIASPELEHYSSLNEIPSGLDIDINLENDLTRVEGRRDWSIKPKFREIAALGLRTEEEAEWYQAHPVIEKVCSWISTTDFTNSEDLPIPDNGSSLNFNPERHEGGSAALINNDGKCGISNEHNSVVNLGENNGLLIRSQDGELPIKITSCYSVVSSDKSVSNLDNQLEELDTPIGLSSVIKIVR